MLYLLIMKCVLKMGMFDCFEVKTNQLLDSVI